MQSWRFSSVFPKGSGRIGGAYSRSEVPWNRTEGKQGRDRGAQQDSEWHETGKTIPIIWFSNLSFKIRIQSTPLAISVYMFFTAHLSGKECIPHWIQNNRTFKNIIINYRVFNLKVDSILIWVIYLPRFTTCDFTQLTCIYSKCWKWCPFISVHLSTRFTMFLATFLTDCGSCPKVNLFHWIFLIIFAAALFTGACLLNFSKKLCLQWV